MQKNVAMQHKMTILYKTRGRTIATFKKNQQSPKSCQIKFSEEIKMTTATKTKTATPKTTAATKAADTKTEDAFAFPAMPAMDVPPVFRDLAENSVSQSKEVYSKLKTAAEDATSMLNDTIEKTRDGVLELNTRALDAVQENTDATFSHVKDVFAVKSFSEAVELQTAFFKNQLDAMQGQAKAFQEAATKLTEETSAPYKDAFQKTVNSIKAA